MGPVEELRARLGPGGTRPAAAPESSRSSTATACGWASSSIRCWTSRGSRPAGWRPASSRSTWRPSPPTWPASSARRWTGPAWLSRWTAASCPQPVYIDREMWEKVVLNLLSNALKFTFDGTVSVSLRAEGSHAVLRVTDTGSGIAGGGDARLFERFHRIPTARSRSNEGSGIGLALVRELVGLHGGTITAREHRGGGHHLHRPAPVRPRAPAGGEPGRGRPPERSRRRPTLSWPRPCAGCPPISRPSPPWLRPGGGPPRRDLAARDLAGRGARARVLLADDNADMREYLQRLLQPGYQVTAVGGRAGRAGRGPGAALRPGDQRRDDAGAGRPAAGRGAARRLAHRRPAGAAAVRPGRAGGGDRGPGGGRGRLPGQAVLGRRAAGPGPGERGTGPAAQPPRPVARRADRLAARGVLPVRRGRPRRRDQRRLHRHPGLRPGGPALRSAVPMVARPGHRSGRPAPEQRGICPARERRARAASWHPSRTATGAGCWVAASFNEVQDPDTGRRMVVGSLRDITAEHYAVQREAALAAMGLLLSQADSLPEALQGALDELQRLWHARRVIAATWTGAGAPSLMSAGRAAGGAGPRPASAGRTCPATLRETIGSLRQRPLLDPDRRNVTGRGHRHRAPGGAAGGLDRRWIPPGRSPPRTGRCSRCCAGISARRCTGPTRSISSGRPPSPCSAPSSARPGCRRASPPATSRPAGRSRWAATGTTWSSCPTGGSASWSATASGTASRPRP